MCNIKNFYFNGQEYCTNHVITLSNLLTYFDYHSQFFIIEYNDFICNRYEWNKITIKKNDKIEIITIVGGG